MEKKQSYWDALAEKHPKLRSAANTAASTFRWAYKLRSVVLAIPVAALSAFLALYNFFALPSLVGFSLQPSGEYAFLVGKLLAVLGPLAVTAICLLLMFCSKKVLYPWLISMFSLILPILILITNTFP